MYSLGTLLVFMVGVSMYEDSQSTHKRERAGQININNVAAVSARGGRLVPRANPGAAPAVSSMEIPGHTVGRRAGLDHRQPYQAGRKQQQQL